MFWVETPKKVQFTEYANMNSFCQTIVIQNYYDKSTGIYGGPPTGPPDLKRLCYEYNIQTEVINRLMAQFIIFYLIPMAGSLISILLFLLISNRLDEHGGKNNLKIQR